MNAPPPAACPWCSAPRDTGLMCPRCGANYAKAEAIKTRGRAALAIGQIQMGVEASDSAARADLETSADEWKKVGDPELEWKFCIAAIPVALCFAVAFHASGLGQALQRIFLTMPIHELGHAVTAWFCGFGAIPSLWKTVVFDTRGFATPLALVSAIGYMIYHAHRTNRLHLMYAGGALIVLQAIATLGINPDTARMLVKRTQLFKGSLRWGFVVIGAAAFVDMYATWLKSRGDDSAIPYGTTGGMATDAMTLVDTYGWTLPTLVHRYFVLGLCCLVALAIVYAWGVWRAKSAMNARRLAQYKADWERRKRQGG